MSNAITFSVLKVKMFNALTLTKFLFWLLSIEYSCSVSITGIIDAHNPNGRMISLPNMKKDGALRSSGIFETFIHNLLELLTTQFPMKKLPKYCRILSRNIYDLNYKYAQRLAKHIKYLSRMYPEDLHGELIFYKKELNKKTRHRSEFLDAMNKAFTLREHILFNDYIYDLRDYGSDDKLYIDEETDKLIDEIILGNILKLSSWDRKELRRRLRYAVKEFTWDIET